MRAAVGGGDLEVVVRHGGVVRPEVAETDGNRPWAGPQNPIRAVEHADNAVDTSGGGAVALLLGGADAAAADDAGVAAVTKAGACNSDCNVKGCHDIARTISSPSTSSSN